MCTFKKVNYGYNIIYNTAKCQIYTKSRYAPHVAKKSGGLKEVVGGVCAWQGGWGGRAGSHGSALGVAVFEDELAFERGR